MSHEQNIIAQPSNIGFTSHQIQPSNQEINKSFPNLNSCTSAIPPMDWASAQSYNLTDHSEDIPVIGKDLEKIKNRKSAGLESRDK